MKDKRYKFNAFGCAQLLLDLRQEKVNRINGRFYLVMIIAMFALGFLGKELFIILIGNTMINKVTGFIFK